MNQPPSDDPPHTFGQRFRERGLIGALRKKGDEKKDPNHMHFLEHLEEMRLVIFKCVLAFVIGCGCVIVFLDDAVRMLQRPLVSAVQDFGSISIDLQTAGLPHLQDELEKQGVGLKDLMNASEAQLMEWGVSDPHERSRLLIHFAGGKDRSLLQVIRSYSPIFIAMKICFLGGLGLSLPFVLYFVGGFVVPGLTPSEKRVFLPGCIVAAILFLAGVGMTYFFILPLSLAFTIDFTFNVLGLGNYRPEAGNYYSTVIWMTFAVGLAFQFPLILVLLMRIGILSVERLRSSRRMVLVLLMISAALITPGGDPVSLCILTVPLYLLYEASILVGLLAQGNSSDAKPSERGKSGLAASIFILASLIALGGGSIWFYKNWNYLEELFLGLDPAEASVDEPAPSGKPGPNTLKTQPLGVHPQEFILELTPMETEANRSLPPGVFHARIRSGGN